MYLAAFIFLPLRKEKKSTLSRQNPPRIQQLIQTCREVYTYLTYVPIYLYLSICNGQFHSSPASYVDCDISDTLDILDT